MKHLLIYAVIFFNCSHYNELVDSNPYAILDHVSPEDTLVFDQNCNLDSYSIRTYGPEGFSATDNGPAVIKASPSIYPYIFKPAHILLQDLFQ